MTIGHRLDAEELSDTSVYELYSPLGERDTPKLFGQRYKVDTDHDIPTGAGNSIDRKTIYVDRLLYQEAMDGAFEATGLTPGQIIGRFLDHEHTEIVLAAGNNSLDTYYPCHERALKREHDGVCAILCPTSPSERAKTLERYEATIWPALVRCYHRPVGKPPADLWCAPILDEPTERDEEILAAFRKLGVIDATKHSKYERHYGVGEKQCISCHGWLPELLSQEHGALAGCRRVAGMVRRDRWCDLWNPKT